MVNTGGSLYIKGREIRERKKTQQGKITDN